MTKTIEDVWDDPNRHYPSIIYIETTNICNAHCTCCPIGTYKRPKGIMSFDNFKIIADKIISTGCKIGAMFCFGEPLIDITLFDKYKYAKELGILNGHVGLNTNCSLLTSDKFNNILRHTPNITLSFFNTEKEYERMTGLSWEQSYKNACEFIKYRDAHYPGYPITIGVNRVKGSSIENVKKAFSNFNLFYAQDAEINYMDKVITGPLDRHIIYRQHHLGCDGYKGAMHIKFNGTCCFCAYDVVGSISYWETQFANIFIDDWVEIERKFKEKFRSCPSLCARCEYWYHVKEVLANDYKKPNPLPSDWYDWQKPFLLEGEKYYD